MDKTEAVKPVTVSSNAGEMNSFPHIYPDSSLETR